MRHEQSASYAAGAVGYLTGRPGVGPHGLWPGHDERDLRSRQRAEQLLPNDLLSGANGSDQMGMGDSTEAPQIEAASTVHKLRDAAETPQRLPFYIEQAVRSSLYGRPGATYLDLMDDVDLGCLRTKKAVNYPPRVPEPPRPNFTDDKSIEDGDAAIRSASNRS